MDVTCMFLSISPTINKAKTYSNANKQIKVQLNTDTLLTWYLVTLVKVISICDSIYLKMFVNSGLLFKWNKLLPNTTIQKLKNLWSLVSTFNQDEVIARLISVVFTLAAFPLACLVFWSIIRCHKWDKQEFVFFNALQISGLSMTFSVF